MKKSRRNKTNREFIEPIEHWDLEKGFQARVVEVHKRYAFVSTEPKEGEVDTTDVWMATVARRHLQSERQERHFVCVGDRVYCQKASEDICDDLPQCTIEARAPRTAKIFRKDPMVAERLHILAANMTQLIVVSSYQSPLVKWGLIDRYLALAEAEGLEAVIVLNKEDLLVGAKEGFQEECAEQQKIYEDMGYRVLSLQASSPSAMKEVRKLFRGHISLVSGHSGVGKSSMVNLARPELKQVVEKDEIMTKGRHTTSFASFIRLGSGGYVVDSPGIRSFVAPDMEGATLSRCFRDIEPYVDSCRFRECLHNEEPGCAVKAAVEQGLVAQRRYRSYLGILLGTTGREGRLRNH
ncbi:MAG: ribosome small subunit-dependent GTPase A [Oligoflexales bacterium]